jgi:hypothetical protein
MSVKNSLDAKALRRQTKNYDRGYPSFYDQTKSSESFIIKLQRESKQYYCNWVLGSLNVGA